MDFEETLLVLRSDALIVAHSGNGVANVPTGRRISGIHLNRSEFLSGMALDGAKIRVGYLFELSCLLSRETDNAGLRCDGLNVAQHIIGLSVAAVAVDFVVVCHNELGG